MFACLVYLRLLHTRKCSVDSTQIGEIIQSVSFNLFHLKLQLHNKNPGYSNIIDIHFVALCPHLGSLAFEVVIMI
jgi:hypothetical protein